MAYDQHLAERISGVLREKHVGFEAKNMMGGLCYMVRDKMALGVVKDSLMIRIDPELYDQSLKKKGVRRMDFTGKVLKGFLLVDPIGIDLQKDLEYWIELSLGFNPKAKSSKKRTASKKAISAGAKRKR